MFKKRKSQDNLSSAELEIKLLSAIENAFPPYSNELILFRETFGTPPKNAKESQLRFDKCIKRGYISKSTHITLTKEGALRLDKLIDNCETRERLQRSEIRAERNFVIAVIGAVTGAVSLIVTVISLFL